MLVSHFRRIKCPKSTGTEGLWATALGYTKAMALEAKYGATTHNTFEFDGGVLKPKTGANSSNTFEFDGRKIKPKYGANSSNTWVIQGNVVKPDFGSNSSNTYDINGAPIAVIIGQVCLKLW